MQIQYLKIIWKKIKRAEKVLFGFEQQGAPNVQIIKWRGINRKYSKDLTAPENVTSWSGTAVIFEDVS